MTHHAPARRSEPAEIERQKALVAAHCGPLGPLYDAVSELVLVVNEDRQIVFFNVHAAKALGGDDPTGLYGRRPGEILDCVHACEHAGGCGTGEFCSQCGAVNAILSALVDKADLRECSLQPAGRHEALDLLVRTTPLRIEGQMFSIVAVTDISHEKRRRSLERIFFHDVMNTAVGLNFLAEMLETTPGDAKTLGNRRLLAQASRQLIEELKSQKDLLAAENNELQPDRQSVDGHRLARTIVDLLADRHKDHRIVLAAPARPVVLQSDPSLLGRVLGNMIRNAVEATEPHQAITVACDAVDGHAEFRVHNPVFIPREVRLQLFQRSFSTKGPGRGLGTYSMKLLSERYLGGTVHCRSSQQDGTVFIARYPLGEPRRCGE
ncbi:MAG: GHKL domain-containing protein [Planctomycetes bacterium]|nr:GHKL domain-containing protein [Planctomycetota bacterium]